MHQYRIGNAGQAFLRLIIADHQRFAAGVGAGHHQDERLWLCHPVRAYGPAAGFMEDQPVDRRVGQHDAQPGEAGGEVRKNRVDAWLLAQQNNRALRGLQQRGLGGVDLDVIHDRGQIGSHHGERLFFPVLASAQGLYGFSVARVAGQMEAAQALDGDDLAGAQVMQHVSDGVYPPSLTGGGGGAVGEGSLVISFNPQRALSPTLPPRGREQYA
jgi:hypothetical protein